MEDFFSQYGKVIIAIVVVAVLLLIVGTSDQSGLSKFISQALNGAVTKFSGMFDSIFGNVPAI